jgi:hypothetical protein
LVAERFTLIPRPTRYHGIFANTISPQRSSLLERRGGDASDLQVRPTPLCEWTWPRELPRTHDKGTGNTTSTETTGYERVQVMRCEGGTTILLRTMQGRTTMRTMYGRSCPYVHAGHRRELRRGHPHRMDEALGICTRAFEPPDCVGRGLVGCEFNHDTQAHGYRCDRQRHAPPTQEGTEDNMRHLQPRYQSRRRQDMPTLWTPPALPTLRTSPPMRSFPNP